MTYSDAPTFELWKRFYRGDILSNREVEILISDCEMAERYLSNNPYMDLSYKENRLNLLELRSFSKSCPSYEKCVRFIGLAEDKKTVVDEIRVGLYTLSCTDDETKKKWDIYPDGEKELKKFLRRKRNKYFSGETNHLSNIFPKDRWID